MNSAHDDVSMQANTVFNITYEEQDDQDDHDDHDNFIFHVTEYINFLRLLSGQLTLEDVNYEFTMDSGNEDFEYDDGLLDIRQYITVTATAAVDTFQPRNFVMRADCSRTDTPIINDTCCICLDALVETDKQIAQLDACQHGFCAECLFMWLKTHCVCPVCRTLCIKINLIK